MKTILIVDQEKNTTFTLQKLLESESFNVFSSQSLREAIAILNARQLDLVVVNREMPAIEGFDIVQWLADYSPKTHIITLSTAGSPEVKRDQVLADYPKPLDFFSLVKTIKTTLANKGFSGILSDISLQDYIQMFCMNGSTRAILVSQKNEQGIILIKDGNVVYAMQDQLKGEKAFFQIMSWKKGTFKEVKIKKFPEANIHKDFKFLLIEYASHTTITQVTEKDDREDGETSELTISPKTAVKGMSEKEANPPVEDISQVFPADASENKNDTVAIGQTPHIKRRNRWKKIAMAAILALLIIAVGLNSFFFSSETADVSAQQNGKAAVTADTGRSSDPLAPVKKPQKKIEVTHATSVAQTVASPVAVNPVVKKDNPVVTPAPAVSTTEQLPETVILRLHGSNTIGAQLAPALAQSFLKDIRKAPKVEVAPGMANEVAIRAIYDDRIEAIEIRAHGSATGFEGLAGGICDIAMSSRKIKPVEVEQLKGLGDMTAITNEHVIGLDGVAVIVNKGNSLDKLDTRKLADIFAGKIVDWAEIQEKPGPITAYARDDKSGTFDTFKNIVLGKTELQANIQRFESNPELSDKVAMDPLGIGFTSLPNIRKAKGLAIAEEGAGAIYPSFFTVATEDYPLSRRLYLYTETNPARPIVRDFVEYAHSRFGQEIVKNLGFVDLNIKSFVADAMGSADIKNSESIRPYVETIKDSERLSLNFRFRNNLAILDNRGMRDLDRMVDFLKERMDKKILLAGFADNAGDSGYNRDLAFERAETVAKELRARGIAINKVISVGEELPVASNSTEQGREKNRRVEVWIR